MIKKIILIVLLLPFVGWSQPTEFYKEETDFAMSVLEKRKKNISQPLDEYLLELEAALQKVPYHPNLVQSLLRIKLYDKKDFKFICNYCKKLDDYYLTTYQGVLVELCAYAYFAQEDYEELYNRVTPLIEDKNIKDLYLAAYYYHKNNEEAFVKHLKYALFVSYKYSSLNYLRDIHLQNYRNIIINQRNSNSIKSFLKDYEKAFFLSNLPTSFYVDIIEKATFTLNFDLAERLIKYVEKLNTEKYKYLYPIIAYYQSYKGEESLAVEALDKAFEMDRIGFKNSYPVNIAHIFNESIFNLKDFKTKERMFDKGMQYFEGMNDYKIKFKIGKSMLLATQDVKVASALLKECEPFLNARNYNDFKNIHLINSEMGKKNPDYRVVDNLLNDVVSTLDVHPTYFQKIMFCYRVNYRAKKPVFTLNEILEDYDKILSKPLSKADEQYYLIYKLRMINEYDKELLMKEIEKLSDDFANELTESLNVEVINSEKTANATKPETISTAVDFITINYLKMNQLKN